MAEAALSYDQGALTLTATWTNDGNAPFYFDWKPWVRLTDASGRGRLIEADMDIRTVMPGEQATMKLALGSPPASAVRVELAIPDPDTGEPAVALAMDVPERSGWYELFGIGP